MIIRKSILALSSLVLVSACSGGSRSTSSTGILPGESSDTDTTTATTAETSSETGTGTATKTSTATGTGTGAGSGTGSGLGSGTDSGSNTAVLLNVPDRALTIDGIADQAATVNWYAANGDAITYRVCVGLPGTAMTTTDEVVSACDASPVPTTWGAALTSTLAGMTSDQEYAVNVLAKDAGGQLAIYAANAFDTNTDATAPTLPAGAILSVSGLTDLGFQVSWAAATDPLSADSGLDYRVCLSTANDIGSSAAMNIHCVWQTRFSRGLALATVDGLMSGKTYYVNVLVQDRQGNQAAYTAKSVTTPAASVPVFYVDDNYAITTDAGAGGLTSGDTVTFAPGEFGEKTGLTFGTTAFPTLSAAVAAATTGGRIVLGSGSFGVTSQLVLDADLAIVGQGKASTTISIGYSTGSSGDARGALLAKATRSVFFGNLTINGTGFNVYQAVRSWGNLTVSNSEIKNVRFAQYLGAALAILGPTNAARNCRFVNIERVGFNYLNAGGTLTILWNEYVGKGPGDWIDYMVSGSEMNEVLARENYIHDAVGVASVDNSQSMAMLVFAPSNTQAHFTAERNVVEDTTYGFWIGNGAADYTSVDVTKNVLLNVAHGLQNNGPLPVNAFNNYWGAPSGPMVASNPDGTGAIIASSFTADDVAYDPWATEEWIPGP